MQKFAEISSEPTRLIPTVFSQPEMLNAVRPRIASSSPAFRFRAFSTSDRRCSLDYYLVQTPDGNKEHNSCVSCFVVELTGLNR
jgi:hypothetical protein